MYFVYAIIIVGLIGIDYFAKYLVVANFSVSQSVPLWPEVFHLTYAQNTGAAFSIFSEHTVILTVVTLIIMAGIITYWIVSRPKNKLLLTALSFIIAGGIGNIIDRLTRGFVVDFFDVRIINFAIFNTADVFVSIGAGLLILYLLFFERTKNG